MTGPSTPEGPPPSEDVGPPVDGATSAPVDAAPPSDAAPLPDAGSLPAGPLGLTTFTIEGRRAPALFVVGWIAIVAAIGLASLGMFGPAGTGGSIFWLLTFAAASTGLILLGGAQSIERRAAGAAYAGPSPMLVLLAAAVTTLLAAFLLGIPLQGLAGAIPREIGDLIAVALQALVFVGVVRLMVVGTGALSWREMGLTGSVGAAARAGLYGAAFAIPVIGVTVVVTALAVTVVGAIPDSPLPPTGTPTGLVAHLLAGALIGPFAEEVLFRGFAQTAWQRTLGMRAAIARSTVVFVLAHVILVGGDEFGEAVRLAIVAGVVRIPVAIALGWLFARTGSLWTSFGLHAAFNGILIVLAEVAAGAGGLA